MKLRFPIEGLKPKRLHVLLALLGVAAALAWQSWEGEVSMPSVRANEPAPREPARAEPEGKPLRLDVARLERRKTQEVSADLFDQPKWQEPPPPPLIVVKPPPPPPPKPPELPFSYIGQMIDKGETKVFLSAGAETHTAKAGDTLRGVYLVDSVSPTAVVFTYLPMKMQQTLSIAPAN
jgi:hypothetical protein